MKGQRIAVFGFGRSGLAVGKAALKHGMDAVVYDQKPLGALAKPELVEEARSIGLKVVLGTDPLADARQPDMMVVNPAVDSRNPILAEALRRGIEVVSEVEFAYRIARAPIVAITGTNGKSTTTVMTWLCLRAAGIEAVLCGNIFGSGYDEVPLTDAASVSTPDQALVAEVSSFQLEWVRDFRPVSAGITNVTPDHQDRYNGFEQYAATKRRIYDAQGTGDTAVFRPDDPLTAPTDPRQTCATFGPLGREARIEGNDLCLYDRRIPLAELPFAGEHNLLNASMAGLLAYGAMMPRGIDHRSAMDAIEAGLKSFQGLAHRMQVVGERDGVLFVNNSMCTNPDAVVKSVQSLGRPAHILMGGLNKGLNFEPVRQLLEGSRHHAYPYGTSGADLALLFGTQSFATMQEAFAKAVQNVSPGEAIILAPGCASMDQFHDFRQRGMVFTSLAMEWLQTCSA